MPEDEDDDWCPECGTDWANGEDCDEECPLDEAYQAELADGDEY